MLPFLSIVANTTAQSPDYKARIHSLNNAINTRLTDQSTGLYYETTDTAKNDNKHSYLWPLCAYIQAANEMEVIDTPQNYMQPVIAAINRYYTIRPPMSGYQSYVTREKKADRYYDDNQWIAIAYLDAFQRNHKKENLQRSEVIYHFMLGGLDTVAGGGFYWNEGKKTSKNTCSNGPGILVLLQLYNITHKPKYFITALSVYKWTNKTLQAPDGLYYDNINLADKKIGKEEYTYNTGTMLQANVLLFEITKDKKYLTEAKRIAKAGRKHFFKNGRLPTGYWFNAVMLRGYQALYNIDHNNAWIDFFQKDAEAIWNTERDTNNMVGTKPAKSLIDQAAMIEIYSRLQEIKIKQSLAN